MSPNPRLQRTGLRLPLSRKPLGVTYESQRPRMVMVSRHGGRTMTAMQRFGLLLGLLCVAAHLPVAAFDSAGFVGVWKSHKKALIAKATTYTVLRADGSCSQASKVSVVGTTHWLTDKCTWSIEGATFSVKIMSASDPDLVGTSSAVRIESLSAKTFVYEKDGKLERWEREPSLPAESSAQMPDRDNASQSAPDLPRE